MKKCLTLLMAIIMTTSLYACGEPQVVTETVEVPVVEEVSVIPEEYAGLIDLLDAGDYDGAAAVIEDMKPESEPEFIEIQLSMDNLYDYFEIAEGYSYGEKNEKGKITYATKSTYLVLKKDYTFPEGDFPQSYVISYSYLVNLFDYKNIDFVNWTFKENRTARWKDWEETIQVLKLKDITLYYSIEDCILLQNGDTRPGIELAHRRVNYTNSYSTFNPEILDASGTIYLAAAN